MGRPRTHLRWWGAPGRRCSLAGCRRMRRSGWRGGHAGGSLAPGRVQTAVPGPVPGAQEVPGRPSIISPSSASGKNQVRVRPDGVEQGPRSEETPARAAVLGVPAGGVGWGADNPKGGQLGGRGRSRGQAQALRPACLWRTAGSMSTLPCFSAACSLLLQEVFQGRGAPASAPP